MLSNNIVVPAVLRFTRTLARDRAGNVKLNVMHLDERNGDTLES